MNLLIAAKFFFSLENTGRPNLSFGAGIRYTLLPAYLNSGEIALSAFITSTAKAARVGGTVLSIKVPDMLSLPPIAGISSSCCAQRAPRSALNGRPHFTLSLPRLSKYSWKVRRILSARPPRATIFAAASTTEYIAPWNGLHSIKYGLYP